MSQHNTFAQAFKTALSAALLAATLSGPLAGAAAAQVSAPMSQEVFSQLTARANELGRVRVIVGLDVAVAPNGPASEAQAVTERAAISAAQSQLAGVFSTDTIIRNMETVPYSVLSVTADQLRTLQSTPGITSVVEDGLSAPNLNVSTRLINARFMWAVGINGTGTSVAVLDTGIAYNNAAFLPISQTIVNAACYSSNDATTGATSLCPGGASSVPAGRRAAPATSLTISGAGHGTHTAGTVGARRRPEFRGVAPDTGLIPVQVFSRFPASYCGPSATTDCLLAYQSDQMAALDRVTRWISRYNIAAVNMSLGGGKHTSACNNVNPGYTQLVRRLRGRGVAVVISSGNSGYTDSVGFPGCISFATTVGATDDSDNIASFSNQAPMVDLMAPGVNIVAPYPDTRWSTASLSGTSMAAPHVAGAFALLHEMSPGSTVDQLEQALRCTGVPVTRAGTPGTFYRIDLRAARRAIRTNSIPSC